MPKITVFGTPWCPFCQRADQLLKSKGVTRYETIDVDANPASRADMIARTGRRTVPQIYIGNNHVGGYDDLAALDRSGALDGLLAT